MPLSSRFLDRLIKRLDHLDPKIVQGWILKLVRQKGLLDSVFQMIHEGVIIVDQDLRIHFVNRAAIDLLGLPRDIAQRENQSIGRYLKHVAWERLIPKTAEEWNRVTRQEIELLYPKHTYLELYLAPYTNDDEHSNHHTFTTIILNDVTEIRSRAETAIESEKIKTMTMLAAGVAHEIGNPLNSLGIHLQLLQRQLDNGAEQADGTETRQLLSVSIHEVQRLDAILERFLKAVRPAPLDLHPVSVRDLLRDTVAFMNREIADRGISVEASWPEEVPDILGDEVQLKQAFYNIIKNAIQAMPEGGVLTVELERAPQHVIVRFLDQGKGIAPEELGNIFNPYYTTKEAGSGLGLVIVERIIREHRGELIVESEVGQGTMVGIKFPLATPRVPLLEPHPKTAVITPG